MKATSWTHWMYVALNLDPMFHLMPNCCNSQAEVMNFFEALSVCHTVEVMASCDEKSAEAQSEHDNLITTDIIDRYQASSPDEKAILEGCARLGLIFKGTDNNTMHLSRSFGGHIAADLQYERLHVLEFSSERKRMSVIVRDESGQIWLYSKGAEASILPRCKETSPTAQTDVQITEYAKQGLRTLAVASRTLTEDEYATFLASCKNANIQLSNRKELIEECYESIEVGKLPKTYLIFEIFLQSLLTEID